jgi:ribosomal protein S18 acetylase RimI-like enzyme
MLNMSHHVHIRRMQSEDISVCAAIMATTPLWQRFGVTHASATARLTQGFDSNADIFVAVDPNEPLIAQGFVWSVIRGAFYRSGYIPLLAVSAVQRGAGVGRLLLETAETHLGHTADDVFLLCSDFNHEAQRFYERQGYSQVGRLPDYIMVGVAELIYCKRLRING